MNLISSHFGIALLAIMASGYTLNKAYKRIQLSKAKHRSIRGHAKMSRLIAKLLPFYEFDEEQIKLKSENQFLNRFNGLEKKVQIDCLQAYVRPMVNKKKARGEL